MLCTISLALPLLLTLFLSSVVFIVFLALLIFVVVIQASLSLTNHVQSLAVVAVHVVLKLF